MAIAWLDRPPANSIAPEVVRRAAAAVGRRSTGRHIRALVIASANPMLFCAGADIKAFTKMDAAGGEELLTACTRCCARWSARRSSRSRRSTRSRSAAAASWPWPATSASPRESATFGQPEINLGIIPGFGGTQRLPRLVGEARALEMNLTGDPISAEEAYALGLANRVVPDHELFDTALAWARKLSGQAPLAVEQIKRVSAAGDIDAGIEAEKQAFARVFGSEDAREGIARVPPEAHAAVPGQVSVARDRRHRGGSPGAS